MTWRTLEPPVGSRDPIDKAVTVGLRGFSRRKDGRCTWRIVLTFRKEAVDKAPFLKEGHAVCVALGDGEDAGKVRVFPLLPRQLRPGETAAPSHVVQAASGNKGARYPIVTLEPFKGVDLVQRSGAPVRAWSWHAGAEPWIEVVLPDWACFPKRDKDVPTHDVEAQRGAEGPEAFERSEKQVKALGADSLLPPDYRSLARIDPTVPPVHVRTNILVKNVGPDPTALSQDLADFNERQARKEAAKKKGFSIGASLGDLPLDVGPGAGAALPDDVLVGRARS